MVTVDRVRLECPNCHWVFEAVMPDKRHSVASLEKPKKSAAIDDIIEEKRVCRNPKCRKQFTLYWFDLKMHLDRV